MGFAKRLARWPMWDWSDFRDGNGARPLPVSTGDALHRQSAYPAPIVTEGRLYYNGLHICYRWPHPSDRAGICSLTSRGPIHCQLTGPVHSLLNMSP